MKKFQQLFEKSWVFPAFLFGVVFLVYGYQLAGMGLYWDDWEIIYLDNFHNPVVYWDYFLYARPLTGWLYILMSPLLGMNPVAWQVFNILLRWAGLVGMWWALRMVWPRRGFEIGWVCLLLAVYPAFTQHSVAVTYARHFTCIALFALSLGLNLMAVESQKKWWLFTIIAATASFLQLITLEYFFGLELLRPIFLWIVLSRKNFGWKITLKIVLFQWLPYLLVLILFLGYRFVWYPMVSPNPEANAPVLFERLALDPFGEIIKFANLILQDLVHLNVENWFAPIAPGAIELKAKANWLSWGAGGLLAMISAFVLIRIQPRLNSDENEQDHFVLQTILVGLIGLIAGGIPVWITGRQSIGGPWADRFALGPMFGAVMLLAGLVYWFARRRLPQAVLLGAVFAIAVSSQMQTVNKYRLSWDHQNDFYWQLTWRAPDIKPGTAVIGPSMPFALVNDLHIGFALNAIYDQNAASFIAPIWFFRSGGLVGELIPELKPGHEIDYRYLTAHFKGSTDQVLVTSYSYGSDCLHVTTLEDRLRNDISNDAGVLNKLSNTAWIDPMPAKPATPPASVFGPEPTRGWCYTYQKMELARQQELWEEAAALADNAFSNGLNPKSAVEFTPVILAYQHTAQMEKAIEASLSAQKMDGEQTSYLCYLWEKFGTIDSGIKTDINIAREKLVCDPPNGAVQE